jgi:exodeoxyribonuclease VII large subunit
VSGVPHLPQKAGLRPRAIAERVERQRADVTRQARDLGHAVARRLDERNRHVAHLGQLLASYGYEQTLQRGFAVIRSADGNVLTHAAAIAPGMALRLELQDGERAATADRKGGPPASEAKPRAKPKSAKKSDPPAGGDQGALF